jgi:hypothetical protein
MGKITIACYSPSFKDSKTGSAVLDKVWVDLKTCLCQKSPAIKLFTAVTYDFL